MPKLKCHLVRAKLFPDDDASARDNPVRPLTVLWIARDQDSAELKRKENKEKKNEEKKPASRNRQFWSSLYPDHNL